MFAAISHAGWATGFAVAGLVLGAIEVFRSKAQSVAGWACVALAIAVLLVLH